MDHEAEGSVILHRPDAGAWQVARSPTGITLRGVDMTDGGGWAYGTRVVGFPEQTESVLLRYVDGAWSVRDVAPGLEFAGVAAESSSVALVTVNAGSGSGRTAHIRRYTGAEFAEHDVRAVDTVGPIAYSDGIAWAFGGRGFRATALRSDGGVWQVAEDLSHLQTIVADIVLADDGGWAVGSDGIALRLTSGRWTIDRPPHDPGTGAPIYLDDVSFDPATGAVWAVGSPDSVLRRPMGDLPQPTSTPPGPTPTSFVGPTEPTPTRELQPDRRIRLPVVQNP
jgi:hypothetical protein